MKELSRSRLVYLALLFVIPLASQARNPYKKTFFEDVYPSADGTILSDVASNPGHCGACHYNFDGGGNRNPYGAEMEAAMDAGNSDEAAILAIAWDDSDGDGFPNETEITNTNSYSNTPTFPGLSVANLGGVSLVDVEDIEDYLTPSTGIDTNPPIVTVFNPNGGETATGNAATTVSWNATDASGIAGIDIYVSLDSGSNYTPVALNIPNNGNFTWFVSNRPTSNALIKVEAIDNAGNEGEDVSAAVFTIISTNGFPGT
ncbi:MAG: hypothetical protein ABFR33_05655, partial [Verrucomicrobiota bacterium]